MINCSRLKSWGYRLYITSQRNMIPLPDPDAAPGSPSHVSSYPEFPPGSTVMALYPDTSCFYRAEVIQTPKEMQLSSRVSGCKICRTTPNLKPCRCLRQNTCLPTNSSLRMMTTKNTLSLHTGSLIGLGIERSTIILL
jgi:hypothetical protein